MLAFFLLFFKVGSCFAAELLLDACMLPPKVTEFTRVIRLLGEGTFGKAYLVRDGPINERAMSE